MIQFIGIGKDYVLKGRHGKGGFTVTALKDVNLTLDSTGFVAIAGKSGSGKTTLLNLLSGLDKQTSGKILIDGKDTCDFKAEDYDFYRSYKVGFVFQDYNLLNEMTVADNVALAAKFQEKDRAKVAKRVADALEKAGIPELHDRKIYELSGGQQQRVAIARALAKDSEVFLCDEPTGNLDSVTADGIIEVLKNVAKEKLVVIVTHDEDIAREADRLIRLKDGAVAEDVWLDEGKKGELPPKREKKYCRLGFRNSALMIRSNLWKSKIAALAIIVILATAFSLFTGFYSVSEYDYHDAFVETLKKNDTYTLKLAKYHEYTDAYTDSRGKTIYRGEQDLSPYGVSIDDIPSLRAQADGKADIYPSYTFNKNLHDFFDGFITEAQLRHNDFYASKFQEAIAVENFSTFHLPLLCGNLPTEPNEVLIYDYIAESLIYWELFSGEIKDLQGMTLTDNPSGFSMKVSGILKSGYAQYKDSSRYSYGFRSEYLDSLQSIYCFPEMIASIADDTEYLSVSRSGLNRIGYYIENPEDESDLPWYLTQDFPNTGIKKAKIISELPDCDITPNPYTGDGFNRVSYGVIVSKKQLKKILGNDVELTDEFLEELMTNYRFELGNRVYSMSDVSFWFGADYYIYGITDEDTYEDGALRVYITNPENDMFFYTPSGTFDGLYLSLSDNWNTNSEVLRNFELSVRATNFYEQNPDYDVTGYTNYSPAGILMRSADFYLKNVRDFAKNIILYVAIVAVLGIIFFTVNTIKKNTYKIGVLKTLGARNIDVTVIFGLETLFLSVVAFLISIGVSIFLMKGINYNFTKNIDPSLVFFSIGALDFLVTFLLSVTASVIAALAPLVKLYFTSPISIVKSNNRK